MGVKGLYGYIKRENIKGAIKDHSLNEILQDIRLQKRNHDKAPKILINLRAINNYYEETLTDVIFGCRFNKIKEDFEKLLGSLKAAGAELLFVSKKSNLDKDDEIRWKQLNEDYTMGINFVKELSKEESTRELTDRLKKQRFYPWQDTTIIVLTQSAQKFGEFRENDCLETTFIAGQAQTAKDEDVYAICGLDTSYLLYPGTWKFFFPTKNFRSRQKETIFREISKQALLRHFKFNYEQLQLFSALGGKFHSTVENADILARHFRTGKFQNFNKIVDFVHKHAPAEKFPLQPETIKDILEKIFISPIDEDLILHFNEAINFKPKLYQNEHVAVDKKVVALLQNNPFSSFAECLLNNLPLDILSPFLDVTETDMKPLKDLTIDWIQRTGGILFGNKEAKWPVFYRLQSGDVERVEVEAEISDNVPEWKNLIHKEVSMDDKYKALAFLTNSVISEENLKKIPLDYLMHAIIAVHLVQNDSMTVTEAIAMTKGMRTITHGFTVYPQKVNIRAFRVSALYEKMYSVLVMCLSPLGMNDFIADLTLDNVQFQNIYNELAEWPRGFKNADKKNAFDLIMAIINEE